MMKKTLICTFLVLVSSMTAMAQVDRIETQRGNEAYANGDMESAIEHYNKALEANPEFKEALFNLGTTYQAMSTAMAQKVTTIEDPKEKEQYVTQMQSFSKQAAAEYEKVNEIVESDEEINNSQYNLGNAQLVGGELDKSIEAFKEALRKNPTDEEARYNLAYAKRLKQEQEQQQQEQQQDQSQDQEKKEDEKQDQNDQQNKDQPQDQQQQPQEMSKEEAEQLLEALKKQEKDLQEKLNKKKKPAKRVKIEKDW